MKTILSIQSHVAHGYVGNKAAVFPLQCLDYDVLPINTVQFSNHTGHGSWTGQVFSADHIRDVLSGVNDLGVLQTIDAVLSGYLGSAEIGELILETVTDLKQNNPELIYCCDPVMGDTGRGFFVKDTIPPFFQAQALSQATIITPNQFELSALSGMDIQTTKDAQDACHLLHQKGPGLILVTSVDTKETPEKNIQMLLSSKNGETHLITTPKLDFDPGPNGSGDLTAALFLGYWLETQDIKKTLEKTASSVFSVLKNTHGINPSSRDLALIQSQESFKAKAQSLFTAFCA